MIHTQNQQKDHDKKIYICHEQHIQEKFMRAYMTYQLPIARNKQHYTEFVPVRLHSLRAHCASIRLHSPRARFTQDERYKNRGNAHD
jgi:hypothetical protein